MSGRPILVTGGSGLIGRSFVDRLASLDREVVSTGSERDLRDASVARALMSEVRPDVVVHLAARVGGIYANNTQKPGFYRDNVLINTHLVDAAVETGVEYVLAMGTGCAYPKRLEGQLLREDDYLDGVPEGTNDAYAYAKRGMLVHLDALAEHGTLDYCYCLPANIYGPHDNFHPEHSHVVAGLVRRIVESRDAGAPEVAIWGDGSAMRDFLYIQDCVDAMLRLLEVRYSGVVNVATGIQTPIRTLAETIVAAAEYPGRLTYDTSMPTGQLRREFDASRMKALGWAPAHSLSAGIAKTVAWYEANRDSVRER